MKLRTAVLALVLLTAAAGSVGAEPLPRPVRAQPLSESAAREQAASEVGFGPRAQAALAGELGLWRWLTGRWQWTLATDAQLAVDNATRKVALPQELLRGHWRVSAVVQRKTAGPLLWEGHVALLHTFARAIGDYDPLPLQRPDGIPFGGGGTGLEVALGAATNSGRHHSNVRVTARLYPSALFAAASQPELASMLTSWGTTALHSAAAVDAQWRLDRSGLWQPQVALRAEGWMPADTSASVSGFVRLLAGPRIGGSEGWLWPYVAAEAGSGAGMLINRHEVRLSIGVRYAPD